MRQVRLFTRMEAESTLPLVRRIVADIQEEYGHYRQAMRRYDASLRVPEEDRAESHRLWEEAMIPAGVMSRYIEELDGVGCVLKDFSTGAVDFPSLLEDRVVLLCWYADEKRISHWHEVDAGFSGRQPIDQPFSEVLP